MFDVCFLFRFISESYKAVTKRSWSKLLLQNISCLSPLILKIHRKVFKISYSLYWVITQLSKQTFVERRKFLYGNRSVEKFSGKQKCQHCYHVLLWTLPAAILDKWKKKLNLFFFHFVLTQTVLWRPSRPS